MSTHGGPHAYQVSQQLSAQAPPFAALIFAAMLKADTHNLALLRAAFPHLYDELVERENTPGGLLPTD